MKFLLDTNAWIGHLRQKSPTVSYRLGQHPASDVILCSVVLAELVYGAERSGPAHRAANFALIAQLRQQYLCLLFDDPAAEEYGRISIPLGQPGHATTWALCDTWALCLASANASLAVTHLLTTHFFLQCPAYQS